MAPQTGPDHQTRPPGAVRRSVWVTPDRLAPCIALQRSVAEVTAMGAVVAMFLQSWGIVAACVAVFVVATYVLTYAHGVSGGFDEASRRAAYLAAGAQVSQTDAERACTEAIDALPSAAAAGYLYVIRFSTDVVKVGQTTDPRQRLIKHRRDAAAYGVAIVDIWVSEPHEGYLLTEATLINLCASLGARAKREYLHAADFRKVVQAAEAVTRAAVGGQ